jgi:drug/metabolite transporter (DMT)-like permease
MTILPQQPDRSWAAVSDGPLVSPLVVRRAHLAMIAVAVLISTSFSLGSLVARDIAPVALTFARFGLATCVFAFVMAVTRTQVQLSIPILFRAAIPAAILAVYFVTMFIALETVSPLSTGAVFALVPVLSAVLGWLVLRRTLSLVSILLLLLAGTGAVWVIFDGNLEKLAGFHVGTGEIIYFAGCVLYASYPVFVRKTARGDSPVLLTFLSFAIAMILLLAYDWPIITGMDWASLTLFQTGILFWLAVVPTAITFFLMQYASLRLAPAKVMAYTYLTPACIAPIEAAFGHGFPSVSVISGIVVIIAALVAFEMG